MRTKLFTLLLLLSTAIASAETMRVAILEPVDRENKINYATKLVLRSNLAKAITNATGYEAYDRSDIDAIVGEQNFQRTGMVSEDQIKRLGEMTGAKYILVAEAVMMDDKNMFIAAKVLDVETARVVMSENQMMGVEAIKIQEGCIKLASNLFHVSIPVTNNTAIEKEVIETGVNVKETAIQLVKHTKQEMQVYGKSAYSYGDTPMDIKAMEKFLQNNCPAAYLKYLSGQKMKKAGWTFLAAGAAVIIGGGICTSICNAYSKDAAWSKINANPSLNRDEILKEYEDKSYAAEAGEITCFCIGPIVVSCVAVPLLGVGYYRTNNAHKIFNKQCATPEKLTLNLQSSQNGIGLALNF